MNLYSRKEWIEFRETVIKLDGGGCRKCHRRRSEVVLQVHHKFYVHGRKPWEYEPFECETLCRGCHAEEHGKIMPKTDWELVGSNDLESVCGHCELCGTSLRYLFLICHEKWPALEVGTDCCDHLTASAVASEYMDGYLKDRDKLKRFVASPRWKKDPLGIWTITRDKIEVSIFPKGKTFGIRMEGTKGKQTFATYLDAQIMIFELIESGRASAFLEKRRAVRSEQVKISQPAASLLGSRFNRPLARRLY